MTHPSPPVADQSVGASVPDQALAVPVEPVARLDPTGFDPSREAAALTAKERRYLLATPLQEPSYARMIGWRAGDKNGTRFSGFASRNHWLFTRMRGAVGITYRLSKDGALVRRTSPNPEAPMTNPSVVPDDGLVERLANALIADESSDLRPDYLREALKICLSRCGLALVSVAASDRDVLVGRIAEARKALECISLEARGRDGKGRIVSRATHERLARIADAALIPLGD